MASYKPNDITEDANHAAVENLTGFSFRESGGAASTIVTLRKAAVGGQVLFEVSLAAGESATLILDEGISAEGGTYVQTTGTGTLTGVLYGD